MFFSEIGLRKYTLMHIRFQKSLKILAASIAFIALTCTAAMPPEIDALEFEQPEGLELGIYVADILTGEVLADARADEPFIPASIMKAVTAASVVTLFDPYTRFSTKVTVRGHIDPDHVLIGDIVVNASGDPTLESARYPDYSGICDSIAAGLRRVGIDSVAGTVVADYKSMPESGFPEGWLASDRKYRYGAGHFPINWRDNSFTLTMPKKKVFPEVPGLEVKYVKRRRGALKYSFDPEELILTATGRMPRKETISTHGLPDPAAAMCRELVTSLRDRGIGIGLHPMTVNEAEITIYDHHSPTLDEILMSMMYWSDNLQAEAMLRIIAPTEQRRVAAERELALWRLKGADTDNVNIVDGSGLSRNDRLTPLFLADVLESMALSPRGMTYARLFPIAGRNGTVKRFLSDTPLEGKIALKSGTMSGVRCVAGYKIDDEGYPTHVVVVMTNGEGIQPARLNKAIEQALLKIFQ